MIPTPLCAVKALERRVGYRRGGLVLYGIIWVLIGAAMFYEPTPVKPPEAFVLHEHLPVWLRGTMWVTTGTYAVWFGWFRGRLEDGVAWAALMVMPVQRCVSFFFSWVTWCVAPLIDDPKIQGYKPGLAAAFVYLIIVLLLARSVNHRCPQTMVVPPPPVVDGVGGR